MKRSLKDIGIIALGWVFVFAGTIGLFLPIFPGFLFLLIGLYLLSKRSFWAKRVLGKLRRRFPRLSGMFELARWKGERFIRRIEKKYERKKIIKKIKKKDLVDRIRMLY